MEATARNQNTIRNKTKLWFQLDNENLQSQTQTIKQKQVFFNDLLNAVNHDFPKQHRHFLIKFILSNSIDSRRNIFSLFSRFKQFGIPPQKEISPLSVNPFIFTNQNQNFAKINTQKTRNHNQSKRYEASYSSRNKRVTTPAKRQNTIIFNKKNLLDLDRKMQTKYINSIADKLLFKSPVYYQKPHKMKRNVMLGQQRSYRGILQRRFKTEAEAENNSSEIPSNYMDQLLKTKQTDLYLLNRRSLMTRYSHRMKY